MSLRERTTRWQLKKEDGGRGPGEYINPLSGRRQPSAPANCQVVLSSSHSLFSPSPTPSLIPFPYVYRKVLRECRSSRRNGRTGPVPQRETRTGGSSRRRCWPTTLTRLCVSLKAKSKALRGDDYTRLDSPIIGRHHLQQLSVQHPQL